MTGVTNGTAVPNVSWSELAERFGTPLYVYDAEALADQYLGLRSRLNPALELFFSLKSNPSLAVCAVLRGLGAGAEVSSLAELVTAQRCGVPARDIIFPGPGKSSAELAACLDAGIYAIICESFDELALVDRLARERGTVAPVAVRVNPDFTVKGAKLTMGGRARQFGIDAEQLWGAADRLRRLTSVRLLGVHAYLGTRILREEVIAENTARVLDLARRLADHLDFPLDFVDVGGGLGVAYFDGETDLDAARVADLVNPVVDTFAAANPGTRLAMELGRYLTAPCGVYVMRVRYTKESLGERFAIVDGGTHHHMAAVGIGSFVKRNFPMRVLNRPDEPADQAWTIAGPLCTPNDTVGSRVAMPALRPGDLIGVLRSGAYGPTASPVRFLSHGYPAEVLVHNGQAHLVRARDEVADLLRGQYLPPVVGVPVGAGANEQR